MAGNPKVYAQLVQLLAPYTHVHRRRGDVHAAGVPPEATATEAFVASVVAAPTAEAAAPKKTALRIRKSEPGAKKLG